MRERKKKFSINIAMIVLNVVVFLIVDLSGNSGNTEHMLRCGAANAALIVEAKEYYRLFTSMFLHFGMVHLANNMLVLYVIGDNLERAVGKVKYLLIYLFSGLGGNILSCYLEYQEGALSVSAGASGAIFGVMGAMLYVLLANHGRLEDLTARQIVIMAGFSLYFGFTSSGVDNAAHVGGLICGFLVAMLLYHRKRNIVMKSWAE